MSYPDTAETDTDFPLQAHEVNPWPAEPLKTVNVNERDAPDYGSCMTWPVGQAGVATAPTQLLPRRIRRYKGKMWVTNPTGGTATAIVINSKQDPLTNPNPSGATYQLAAAPSSLELPDWDSQQPVYAIAIGGAITVSVIDEAYAQR